MCVGGWGVCGCVCVCGSGMLICFVSALGSHEMGRHKLPIIIITIIIILAVRTKGTHLSGSTGTLRRKTIRIKEERPTLSGHFLP